MNERIARNGNSHDFYFPLLARLYKCSSIVWVKQSGLFVFYAEDKQDKIAMA